MNLISTHMPGFRSDQITGNASLFAETVTRLQIKAVRVSAV